MKKLFVSLLVLCLMLCAAAVAENNPLLPKHAVSMDDYGTSECSLSATFDTAADLDDQNRLTYTVRLQDLYDPEQVLALQPGDRFMAFGQEMTVETIQIENDTVCVNGESGVYFRREGDMMVCCDYTEDVSCEEAGTYTFPLSNLVEVVTYHMDEEGNLGEGMDEHLFTPDEARAFFVEHSDYDSPFYISAFGSATTVCVKNGEVTRIVIDWSSDS